MVLVLVLVVVVVMAVGLLGSAALLLTGFRASRAAIRQAGAAPLKLLHLVVPKAKN